VANVQEVIVEWIGDSQFSVDRLAEEMNLSTRQLMRKLRALTGETPANMIRRMRMEEAARLLAEGELSVKEVSAQVGYRSTPSFTRAFREVHGEAPSTFMPT
jgi:AraC-like DNA-binding protein